RGANHGPTCRQRTPRPPDVQGGNMTVPNGFLSPRVLRDPPDWQVNFDEAFGIFPHLAWLGLRLQDSFRTFLVVKRQAFSLVPPVKSSSRSPKRPRIGATFGSWVTG